jgi:hypothetical protein
MGHYLNDREPMILRIPSILVPATSPSIKAKHSLVSKAIIESQSYSSLYINRLTHHLQAFSIDVWTIHTKHTMVYAHKLCTKQNCPCADLHVYGHALMVLAFAIGASVNR